VRLLMLAPPGAGKGTQASRLAGRFGIPHLASGELLRAELAAGTPTGLAAREYVDRGDLAPDELVSAMMERRIAGEQHGYVLDGFPRNVAQAEKVSRAGIGLDAVILLEVRRPELLRRLLARGEGRSDDQAMTIRHRLDVYDGDTAPLVAYYRDRGLLVTIDGEQSVDEVAREILDKLAAVVPGG